MRTTLTLDDDVALLLKRLCQERQVSLKALVNQALRDGLQRLDAPTLAVPFRTATVSLGQCLVGNLDDIVEVLALVEGETFQ
jgi:hypothetical protein